jgi:adenylate cyclase
MPGDSVSLAQIQRRIWVWSALLNLAGAFIVYLYFAIVDPLPEGSVPLAAVPAVDLGVFLALLALTLLAGNLWRWRSDRRIAAWYGFLAAGGPDGEVPASVRREVLNVPLRAAARTIAMWLLAGVFFALDTDALRTFLGITGVGGLLTSTLTFLVVEALWRPVVPVFFPEGELGAAGGFRLPVFGRLLGVILLSSLLPPVILVNLTWQRAQSLLAAGNPQAVLQNLLILELFTLVAGALFATGLAVFLTRSITGPVKTLQAAMARVERNDFRAQVPVAANDELGYLGERFNRMVAGLRQGERLRRLFGLYVSPQVARAAVERGAGLAGELVTSTILFSDLRGFTGLSEIMPPEQLIELVNRYMRVMVSAITRHAGIVTRFGGDSIMAVFGSPLNPSGRHAAQAVQAALDMRRALEAFNRQQAAAAGPQLEMGIGIATGRVVSGNVGGEERVEYTLLGDATNLAARLQDKTKELGFAILMSEATYQAASQSLPVQARALPGVAIRGKSQEVTVYALQGG